MKKLILPLMLLMAMSLVFTTSCKEKNERETEMSQEVEMEAEDADVQASQEAAQEMAQEVEYSLPTINIDPDQKVSSPLEVRLNSRGLWMGYEGEVGWAKLLDESGNELASGILKAEGEWMKAGPVMYATTLKFDASGHSGGTLMIRQNPGPGDGDEAGDSGAFEVPVRF